MSLLAPKLELVVSRVRIIHEASVTRTIKLALQSVSGNRPKVMAQLRMSPPGSIALDVPRFSGSLVGSVYEYMLIPLVALLSSLTRYNTYTVISPISSNDVICSTRLGAR